jgi:hypothetical protein
MVVHLTMLCEEVKDGEIIMKMLQFLLPRFKQITITIKTLLNMLTMSFADLTGQLKEVKEAFEEASMSLQQDEKLYLIEDEWDAQRKKHDVENHSVGGTRGGGTGKGHRHGYVHECSGSPSVGSSNKPTSDECQCCRRWGIGHASVTPSHDDNPNTSKGKFDARIHGRDCTQGGEGICPP